MKLRDPKDILHKGVRLSDALEAHGRWLAVEGDGERMDWSSADMSGADMSGANMRYANMRYAYMSGANMSGANMRYADMSDADMSGADMSDADMRYANMRYAKMRYANMRYADMRYANMRYAKMRYADMSGADMSGTIGNMREIKSAQFDQWPLTWTTTPDGEVTLQIGCQRHNLSLWEKSDPRWINAMNPEAAEWWAKYRDIVLALVKASPAIPYGKENI